MVLFLKFEKYNVDNLSKVDVLIRPVLLRPAVHITWGTSCSIKANGSLTVFEGFDQAIRGTILVCGIFINRCFESHYFVRFLSVLHNESVESNHLTLLEQVFARFVQWWKPIVSDLSILELRWVTTLNFLGKPIKRSSEYKKNGVKSPSNRRENKHWSWAVLNRTSTLQWVKVGSKG